MFKLKVWIGKTALIVSHIENWLRVELTGRKNDIIRSIKKVKPLR